MAQPSQEGVGTNSAEAKIKAAIHAAEIAIRMSLTEAGNDGHAKKSLGPQVEDSASYGGIAPAGIPLFSVDTARLVELLRDFYMQLAKNDTREAVKLLLERNEQVISRCALLIGFAGMILLLATFVGSFPAILPESWQRRVFYAIMAVWIFPIVRLLLVLQHRLPPPWQLGTERHLDFVAEIYINRIRHYNLALVTTIASFLALVMLLSPLGIIAVDRFFDH